MRERVSAIIVENGKILLIHRIKKDDDYFVFPGGGVEEDEILKGQKEFFFAVQDFFGIPTISGPELERMNGHNQYIPEWVELAKAVKLTNLFPAEVRSKLNEFL